MTDSCGLSSETLQKAKRELGEDTETRALELSNLGKRLENVPGLNYRTDDAFLLRFLRWRKFDQERAFASVKKFYQVRKDRKDLLGDLKPSSVKHVIDSRILEVLKDRDYEGRRVVIWRAENWDTDRFPLSECFKLFVAMLMKIATEEETQVNGVHFIGNAKGLNLGHVSQFNPSFARTIYSIAMETIPLRIQRMDWVYEPVIFDALFAIMRPFMKEKQLKRRFFNGHKLEGLHATINPDFLPTDLGGKLQPFADNEWFEGFLNSDKEFEEDSKYGFVTMGVEDGKKERSREDACLHGMGGTFKKLNI